MLTKNAALQLGDGSWYGYWNGAIPEVVARASFDYPELSGRDRTGAVTPGDGLKAACERTGRSIIRDEPTHWSQTGQKRSVGRPDTF